MSGTAPVPEVPVVAAEPVAAVAEPTPLDQSAPERLVQAETPVAESPSQPAFTPHTETPSLLEQAGQEPPKPEAAPAEVAAEAPAPIAPTYEPFALPEGTEAAPEAMTAYTGALGKYGITQEAGQELIALHAAQMQQYSEQTLARQHEAFGAMRAGWRDQVLGDPELGGANHQSAMAAVAEVRDRFIPRSGPVHEAFNDMLTSTGVGDHPAFLRFIARIGQALREPAAPTPAMKPPSDIGRKPNGRALADIYDHPSSRVGV